ncbi:hypothetical protein ABN028_07440 [Actinopolymorpha sp. B17G11]|uniref:hypothetical protein n=1 Tax=unclassified Actinopolymorpha TaxID=2627063 RepID=UPI0032D8C418
MSTLTKVARYHLMDRLQYVILPCGVTAFAFLVNLVIFTMVPTPAGGAFTGGLSTLLALLFFPGARSVTRLLPFGFALGLSRRSYYLGTLAFFGALAAVYALGVTVLQGVEGATGGWGVSMHFFRIPWILDGPWYLTWLTSYVVLTLVFVYGMWFGLIYRRWNQAGVVIFTAAQVAVLVVAALAITWLDGWSGVGGFFATSSALGLTGVLVLATAALAFGGFTTMRRVTV